ncbi:MAG TPA: hypothetical protein VHZ51_26325 [Ktedonobacteraceae bacterium]|jgi:hypothetical protein|nr:hypothetical protein [Ktedonobacteraceae bacterium]
MTPDANEGMSQADMEPVSIFALPQYSRWQTTEQRRGFELLRLAFFALKLRKLEWVRASATYIAREDYDYRCNLLRHVIFQQVLALSDLDARDQALQLINACRSSTPS